MSKPRLKDGAGMVWAFMKPFVIPCRDNGDVYLFRLRLVQTPWFGVYLHRIHKKDPHHPHNHPWNFKSIVLWGGYTEDHWVNPYSGAMGQSHREFGRFSAHGMKLNEAHRIVDLKPNTWTLIFVGKRQQEWGFFTNMSGKVRRVDDLHSTGPVNFVHFKTYQDNRGWETMPA